METMNSNSKQEKRGGGCCGSGAGHDHSSHGEHGSGTHFSGPRFRNLVLFGFLAIIGFFLFTEHRAHLFGILPWLLLLLCPLMHLLHRHGSHGGHGSHGQKANSEKKEVSQS